jgi:uncharacterized protein (TIGR03067 family)
MKSCLLMLPLSATLVLGACAEGPPATGRPDAASAQSSAAETAYKADLETLQGTWRPISMELDGEFLPQERLEYTRLTIDGENFTFDTGKDSHGGLYKIDPSHDPKQLDIVITRGDEKGKVYLVIYKFEDGKMVQCMEESNAKRPTEFVGKAGSGNLLEYWQRVD